VEENGKRDKAEVVESSMPASHEKSEGITTMEFAMLIPEPSSEMLHCVPRVQ
jgi:hypothetical protein